MVMLQASHLDEFSRPDWSNTALYTCSRYDGTGHCVLILIEKSELVNTEKH